MPSSAVLSDKQKNVIITARRKQLCEQYALRTVEAMLEPCVSAQWLCSQIRFIRRSHYDDVTEERSLIGWCGYPVCGRRLAGSDSSWQGSRQQYAISTNSNRVYDLTARRRFCSNRCFRASRYLQMQVCSSPLWTREARDSSGVCLLSDSGNARGTAGDAVVFAVQKPSSEDSEPSERGGETRSNIPPSGMSTGELVQLVAEHYDQLQLDISQLSLDPTAESIPSDKHNSGPDKKHRAAHRKVSDPSLNTDPSPTIAISKDFHSPGLSVPSSESANKRLPSYRSDLDNSVSDETAAVPLEESPIEDSVQRTCLATAATNTPSVIEPAENKPDLEKSCQVLNSTNNRAASTLKPCSLQNSHGRCNSNQSRKNQPDKPLKVILDRFRDWLLPKEQLKKFSCDSIEENAQTSEVKSDGDLSLLDDNARRLLSEQNKTIMRFLRGDRRTVTFEDQKDSAENGVVAESNLCSNKTCAEDSDNSPVQYLPAVDSLDTQRQRRAIFYRQAQRCITPLISSLTDGRTTTSGDISAALRHLSSQLCLSAANVTFPCGLNTLTAVCLLRLLHKLPRSHIGDEGSPRIILSDRHLACHLRPYRIELEQLDAGLDQILTCVDFNSNRQ